MQTLLYFAFLAYQDGLRVLHASDLALIQNHKIWWSPFRLKTSLKTFKKWVAQTTDSQIRMAIAQGWQLSPTAKESKIKSSATPANRDLHCWGGGGYLSQLVAMCSQVWKWPTQWQKYKLRCHLPRSISVLKVCSCEYYEKMNLERLFDLVNIG